MNRARYVAAAVAVAVTGGWALGAHAGAAAGDVGSLRVCATGAADEAAFAWADGPDVRRSSLDSNHCAVWEVSAGSYEVAWELRADQTSGRCQRSLGQVAVARPGMTRVQQAGPVFTTVSAGERTDLRLEVTVQCSS